ncbi:MAG: ABC transporter permease [Planctomycetota bacterium]|jgi:putative ABC transport system permease protein
MSRSGRSQFPFSQAVLFALQGIRLRLGRMILVLIGVSLAIAFTNFLLSTSALFAKLAELTEGEAQGQSIQGVFLLLWTGVALLICVAGTVNAIVMSVTERIQEIGTLKCLGCRDFHVVEIFLIESVLLGVIGGIVGSLLGYAASVVNFAASLDAWGLKINVLALILVCMGISAFLSLLASVIPVFMAAKVEPAAAMRYAV